MTVARVRTLVVSVLAAVVAVRVTATHPAAGAYARIHADPLGALRGAADGWSVAGTLGYSTAQGLRELPVAAFFWLADVLSVPLAAGRATWCALVLVLAVVGGVRLARAHGPAQRASSPGEVAADSWTPWAGAALYACAPVMVTTVQHSPGDGLVVALLPWVLVPLVRRDDGWRAAARSAGWLGLAGAGTPPWAIAALAAGVVGAVVTSRRPHGTSQLLRWSLLAGASSSWWIVAYVWEASYAADVAGLSATELSPTQLAVALGLPAVGWAVVVMVGPLAVVGSALVLRVGGDRTLAGALLSLLAAAVLLGMLSGGWPSWLPLPASAGTATDLAPTPWAVLGAWLGLAALLVWSPLVDHLVERLRGVSARQWSRESGAVVVASVVVALAAAGPVLAAQEDASTSSEGDDATAWTQVAAWSASAPPGRVLVLPAAEDARVEPAVAAALRGRPWVARDTLPLSGAGATSALDTVVGRLSRGHDGAGTAAALRDLGVSYVLLRNDLPAETDRERPVALVRHALAGLGASRVAVMEAGDPGSAPGIVDLGVRDPAGSLEIWAVDQAAEGAVLDGELLPVRGDGGAVADLADAGLAPDSAITIGPAPEGSTGIVADSARRQDVDQRVVSDPYGPVLGSEAARSVRPSDAAGTPTASATLDGARDVRASSSAADLSGSHRRTGAVPSAAVDGNAFTAWQSRRGSVVGEWWEITFDGTTDLSGGTLQVVQNAFSSYLVTRVRLEGDGGTTEVDVPPDGRVALGAAGRTARLRVVATAVSGTPDAVRSFGIAELVVPGLEVRRQLVVDGQDADTWVLAARPSSFATCVPSYPFGGAGDPGASEIVCNRGLTVDGPDSGPISRVLLAERGGEVAGRVWMRAADSTQSRQLADRLARPSITAEGSTSASPDLVAGPQAAADADPTTAWRPAPEDEAPTLTLSWDRPSRVTGLRVTTAERRLASQPTHVVVTYAGSSETATGEIGTDGVVELPAVRTRSMSVAFEAEAPQVSSDALTAASRPVPLSVSEVEVIGGPEVTYDADDLEQLPCGSGPDVSVGGESYETAVQATARQVVEASVVTASLCERPVLRAGEVVVRVDASFSWIPLGLVLSPPEGVLGAVDELSAEDPVVAAGVPAGSIGPAPSTTGADLDVDGPATIVLAVPSGTGWTAVADGQELPSLTVDGWAQAWQAPEGASQVSLRYSSAEELRVAAGVGALGWLAVLLLLVVSPRSRLRRPARPGR